MPKLSAAFPMGVCRAGSSLPPHRRDWRLTEHLSAFLDYLKIQNRSVHTRIAYEGDIRELIAFLARSHDTPRQSTIDAHDLERTKHLSSRQAAVVLHVSHAAVNLARHPPPNPAILRLRSTDLTFEAVRRFLAELHRKGLTAQSANRKLVAIRMLVKHLRREGLWTEPRLEYLPPAKTPELLPKWLTVDEVNKVLAVPDLFVWWGRRDAAILELLYAAGLRLSELVGLNLEDVSLSTRWLRVNGKGGRQRMTPFHPCAERAITRYLKDRERVLTTTAHSAEPALFVNYDGQRFGARSVDRLVRRSVREALDRHGSPHILRHSVATHLLERGAGIVEIQAFLGHAKLSTTAKYTHLDTAHLLKVYRSAHPRAELTSEPLALAVE